MEETRQQRRPTNTLNQPTDRFGHPAVAPCGRNSSRIVLALMSNLAGSQPYRRAECCDTEVLTRWVSHPRSRITTAVVWQYRNTKLCETQDPQRGLPSASRFGHWRLRACGGETELRKSTLNGRTRSVYAPAAASVDRWFKQSPSTSSIRMYPVSSIVTYTFPRTSVECGRLPTETGVNASSRK